MTREGAERAVTISALLVAGIYTYRRFTEGSAPAPAGGKLRQLAGQGAPPSGSVFITAWGMTFLVISLIASAAPGLGGALAILVATGDLLGNTSQVAKDVNTKLGKPSSPPGAGTAAPARPSAGAAPRPTPAGAH